MVSLLQESRHAEVKRLDSRQALPVYSQVGGVGGWVGGGGVRWVGRVAGCGGWVAHMSWALVPDSDLEDSVSGMNNMNDHGPSPPPQCRQPLPWPLAEALSGLSRRSGRRRATKPAVTEANSKAIARSAFTLSVRTSRAGRWLAVRRLGSSWEAS